jgi:uncharacterized membrane protein YbhN (UPF0104 family)
MKKQTIFKTILVSSITIAIFYFIFTKIDFYSVVEVLSHANPMYLFLAFLLTVLIPVISAKRWKIILDSMKYDISYIDCFCMIMGTLPFTSITPSKSGDVIKAYYIKDEIPISKTIGSVLTERVFDIFTLVLFSLIGMVFCQNFEYAGIALIALLSIIAIFFIPHVHFNVLKEDSWTNKFHNIILSMKTLTINKNAFSSVMLYSLSSWFLGIMQTLVFFYALGIKIPLLFTMANIPIAILIGMVPVTLGGMGTRDAAIIFLFSGFATPSQLLGVGILFSVFRYWLLSLIGIPFMRKMMKRI